MLKFIVLKTQMIKNPIKPNKTQKTQLNPVGWAFYKKPGGETNPVQVILTRLKIERLTLTRPSNCRKCPLIFMFLFNMFLDHRIRVVTVV